jgi:transcriptional regulator with XRE-family HTH domain
LQDKETTVRSRELGEGLRAAMKTSGYTGKAMAKRLDWSEAKVSRLLSGKRGGTELDISQFLGACELKMAERARLLRLCREMNRPGWHQQHGSRLPKQVRTLIDHENIVQIYSAFQSLLVPGLLQTDEYARAVLKRGANIPYDEIDDRVAARLARGSLFTRERPPEFTFYIHESVLRLPVGGKAVMSDQLHHLLRKSVRPNISMRVVPTCIGAHAATAGPFIHMEFAQIKPVTYLDSETSCLFLEEPEESVAYKRILDDLAATALDEEQSRKLIANVATELYGD